MIRHAIIRCAWDAEAGVWFVQDTDISGLVTEAPTLDALRAKLPDMVRDLVDDAVAVEFDLTGSMTANRALGETGLDKAF